VNQNPGNCARSGYGDLLGGMVSLICALHCLLLPIILPVTTVFAHNIFVEVGLMGMAIAIGCWALYHGYHVHGFRLPFILFTIGIILIIIGNWVLTGGTPIGSLPHNHTHSPSPISITAVAIGGMMVMTAHALNYFWERRETTAAKGSTE
jgi:hypothetical protein